MNFFQKVMSNILRLQPDAQLSEDASEADVLAVLESINLSEESASQDTITALEARLTSVEGSLGSMQSTLDDIETLQSSLEGFDPSAVAASIEALTESTASLKTNLTSVSSKVSDLLGSPAQTSTVEDSIVNSTITNEGEEAEAKKKISFTDLFQGSTARLGSDIGL